MALPRLHLPGLSSARRWVIGLNVLAAIGAASALLVMANYLAARHYQRFHWSSNPADRLSPLTQSVLRALTNDVRITVFFEATANDGLFNDVKALLTEYELSSPRLTVDYVDYTRNPGRAARIKEEFKLAAHDDADLVIFSSSAGHKVVYARELSDIDPSPAFSGRQVRRTAFKGEIFFTSALAQLADPRPFKAYFLTGHGEHPAGDRDSTTGYGKLAELLQEKRIEVVSLSLRTNDIPADCQLLVIAGPRHALPPDELQRIDQYLKGGGRALVLFLPRTPHVGLERLLADWGLTVGDDLVIDRAQAKVGSPGVLLASEFSVHPAVRPLRDGSRVALVMPRSVRPRADEQPGTDTLRADVLLTTGPEGEAVVPTRENEGVVQSRGAIPLAAAVEKGVIAGVTPDRGSTRLLVVGESLFLGNPHLDLEAHRDFANLAANWLLDRSQLLAIGPRPIREYQVALSRSQMNAVRWILLVALPGALLGLGLLVWLRRRS